MGLEIAEKITDNRYDGGMALNPYDISDDGCRCSAWSAGECACGRYVDPSWKRIWQQGYDAAVRERKEDGA